MTSTVSDVLFTLGIGFIVGGCWMLGRPFGVISVGVVCFLLAVALHNSGSKRRTRP